MPEPAAPRNESEPKLPPLILHPFNEQTAPASLLENSRAALMLSGIIPDEGIDASELHRKVLVGRYAEFRMLFFLGKDIFRWLEQCMESMARQPGADEAVLPQSFAGMLTSNPPDAVKSKLNKWGVADYSSIFSRAIGIHALFLEPPAFNALSDDFLRHYHRYADSLFQCYMNVEPHPILSPAAYPFELYASGEYSRLLESEWEKSIPEDNS